MKQIIFSVLLSFAFINISNAQILGNIFDRATDKLSDKISDELNDAIYREIEKHALKAVDKAMDDMLRERYEQDSISGKTGSSGYSGFLKAFATPVDLPPSYTFDMVLLADIKDYDGEKSKIEFMITRDGSLIGIKQFEEDKNFHIVFDITNDIMATYTEEDGVKTVTALPNMLSVGGAFIKVNVDEEDMKRTVEKTGKTKKILGYQTEEWIIEDNETTTKAYIASDFPISWKDSHNQFLKQILPTTQREEMPDGMALKSEAKTKKKNKKSSFEVKKVIDEPTVIDNSQYKKIEFGVEEE